MTNGFLKYDKISAHSSYTCTLLRSPSSYLTLQPLPSEFPSIWGKFNFLFYQCTHCLISSIFNCNVTNLKHIWQFVSTNSKTYLIRIQNWRQFANHWWKKMLSHNKVQIGVMCMTLLVKLNTWNHCHSTVPVYNVHTPIDFFKNSSSVVVEDNRHGFLSLGVNSNLVNINKTLVKSVLLCLNTHHSLHMFLV